MADAILGPLVGRTNRRYSTRSNQAADRRTEFQRDRDRILYSSSLRRLALITQVVSPDEGHTFHNRLTHVMKVAQVGRQLAERLRTDFPEQTEYLGGIEPVVVETAALAHDLGHPPFGHLAEEALDELATEHGFREGFEGNAQSFRVVTKLEIRDADSRFPGLNLTRASLNAILKYPWPRSSSGKHSEKWGAYDSEVDDFDFARMGCRAAVAERCIEAQIMDWADDIAYSTHDMDDFYRANKVPVWKLVDDEDERADLVDHMVNRKVIQEADRKYYEELATKLFHNGPVSEPFDGSRGTIGAMRVFVSTLISDLESGTALSEKGLVIKPECEAKVKVLKELVWKYVIHNPTLATQQYGQREIISELYDIFSEAARSRATHKLFPGEYREALQSDNSDLQARTVLDYIAGLTEPQAIRLHHRLTGHNFGNVLFG